MGKLSQDLTGGDIINGDDLIKVSGLCNDVTNYYLYLFIVFYFITTLLNTTNMCIVFLYFNEYILLPISKSVSSSGAGTALLICPGFILLNTSHTHTLLRLCTI